MRAGQRYLVGAVAFAAAALWLGVGLVGAFECLLVFGLAMLVVAALQRREEVNARRARRTSGARARRPASSRGRRPRRSTPERAAPAWPARPHDEQSDDWRRAARADW
jgi:hypothetical protein